MLRQTVKRGCHQSAPPGSVDLRRKLCTQGPRRCYGRDSDRMTTPRGPSGRCPQASRWEAAGRVTAGLQQQQPDAALEGVCTGSHPLCHCHHCHHCHPARGQEVRQAPPLPWLLARQGRLSDGPALAVLLPGTPHTRCTEPHPRCSRRCIERTATPRLPGYAGLLRGRAPGEERGWEAVASAWEQHQHLLLHQLRPTWRRWKWWW